MSALTGFTVADGSPENGPSANSYVSVEQFETYLADYPPEPMLPDGALEPMIPTPVLPANPSDQQRADYEAALAKIAKRKSEIERELKIAAQMLDGIGLADNRWKGQRVDPEQVLAWPRANVRYDKGGDFPSNKIPHAICLAQCVIAVYLLQGQVEPDESVNPNDTVKREQVGPIMTEYAIYGRYVYLGRTIQNRVEEIIGGLIKPIGDTLAEATGVGFGGGVFGFEYPSGVVDVNVVNFPGAIDN